MDDHVSGRAVSELRSLAQRGLCRLFLLLISAFAAAAQAALVLNVAGGGGPAPCKHSS